MGQRKSLRDKINRNITREERHQRRQELREQRHKAGEPLAEADREYMKQGEKK